MCFGNRLPRQSADWLAMTGFFDSLCQREALTEGLSFPGGAEPRPYTRLPIAFAPSVRADVGIRPYEITGGVCVIRTGGQSRPPLHPPTAPALCPYPVIPSQCSHWRGNPFPAPAGAEHPRGGSSKGIFRAPARGTFALGGKSTQKRRSNLRFENPFARLHPPRILTAFATRTLCPANFT